MSGLALVAHALGASVTGSDCAESSYLETLRDAGIPVALGHQASNLPAGAEVIVSSAVPAENPERTAARERGQRELHRAELLGEVTALKACVAVTGTHGKTTTAAMVVHALQGAGAHPSYVVGAELRTTGRNAAWGSGEWLVVEADESDRSLLKLHPDVAVLTNAELDHHATYASRLDLDETFRCFLGLAEQAVIWDRPELLALRAGAVVPYDLPDDLVLDAAGVRFTWRGARVSLRVPGAHNALDAVGALEACRLTGADPDRAAAALATFRSAGRRFERLGQTTSGAVVYDDYAHHPTEVRATLEAARTLGGRRLVAVFQPHLFSRTAALHRAFGGALALADRVAVLDVYPARERAGDFPGVSGRLVACSAADAREGRQVAWLPGFDAAERYLRAELREGDVCVVLGAGDVDVLGRRLVGS